MQVFICGGTGLIGQALTRFFKQKGCDVDYITRKNLQLPSHLLADKIIDADLLINVAGSPILTRWTEEAKQNIIESRVNVTQQLVNAINVASKPPKVFISTSAVGIYKSDDYDAHDEFSDRFASDFLGELCKKWEAEVLKINHQQTRIVIFRLGVVLGKESQLIKKMITPFMLNMGGYVGDGKQWFPFIHIHDLVRAFWFVSQNIQSKGIYNLVSPHSITNEIFTNCFAKSLNKSVPFHISPRIIKLMFGESATVLLNGQEVEPYRLLQQGFTFQYPEIQQALHQILYAKK